MPRGVHNFRRRTVVDLVLPLRCVETDGRYAGLYGGDMQRQQSLAGRTTYFLPTPTLYIILFLILAFSV